MAAMMDDHPPSSLPHRSSSKAPSGHSMQSPSIDKFPIHNPPTSSIAAVGASNGWQRSHYKSYKKKFLKLRHGFDGQMRASNEMFENEDRLEKISRRLKEQNDALRELLIDINDSKCIPDHQRFDLSLSNGHANGEDDTASRPEAGLIPLSGLQRLPQSTLEKVQADETYREEIDETVAPSYFSLSQEEEYLRTLDAKLGLTPAIPTDIPSLPLKPVDRDREHYKDVQLRNPVSVYNWLKRNRPEIFLQETSDTEDPPKKSAKSKPRGAIVPGTNVVETTGKSSPKPAAQPRASKRARAETIKQEEILDDDGNVIGGVYEEPIAPKNKRKREDEPYRPKGGSSKKKKRKTASGSTPLSKEMVEDMED